MDFTLGGAYEEVVFQIIRGETTRGTIRAPGTRATRVMWEAVGSLAAEGGTRVGGRSCGQLTDARMARG